MPHPTPRFSVSNKTDSRNHERQSSHPRDQIDEDNIPMMQYENPHTRDNSLDQINYENFNFGEINNDNNWGPGLDNGGYRGDAGEPVYEDILQDRTYHRRHSKHRNLNATKGKNIVKAYEARTGGYLPTGNGLNPQIMEERACMIVEKMEKDPALMEDSPKSELLRKETLRDMPQCLTLKKCVKNKLSTLTIRSKKKPLSYSAELKYKIKFGLMKFKSKLTNLVSYFELWYSSLKEIEGNFGSGVASYFRFLRWTFVLNCLMLIPVIIFIVIPQIIDGPVDNSNSSFNFIDLFTGRDYLSNTLLFYGYYSSTETTLFNFYMPEAYFYVMIAVYLLSLFILGYSAATSYRKSFIETHDDGLKNVMSNKVFCSWDYNISNRNAARLKSSAIYHELKELLYDIENKNKEKVSIWIVIRNKVYQIFVHLVFLGLLIAVGYLVWQSFDKDFPVIISAALINGIMIFAPVLLGQIIKYEFYSPRIQLHITLLRTFSLGFVVMAVVMTYFLINKQGCWETLLGQELYRLMVFDFIFSVIFTFIYDLILYGIYKRFSHGELTFDIARNTMEIIYNQSLLWAGLFMSPLLLVLTVIKLFCTWYVRQMTAMYLCKPSNKIWRAAHTETWFKIMAFMSLLLISGVYGYSIMEIETSKCGPFQNYTYIHDIVTGNFSENSSFKIHILIAPGTVTMILITLCVLIYFARAKSQAKQRQVEMYKEMLQSKMKDKKELLQRILSITGKDLQYKVQSDRELDPMKDMFVDKGYQQQPNERGEIFGEDRVENVGDGHNVPRRMTEPMTTVHADRQDQQIHRRGGNIAGSLISTESIRSDGSKYSRFPQY